MWPNGCTCLKAITQQTNRILDRILVGDLRVVRAALCHHLCACVVIPNLEKTPRSSGGRRVFSWKETLQRTLHGQPVNVACKTITLLSSLSHGCERKPFVRHMWKRGAQQRTYTGFPAR